MRNRRISTATALAVLFSSAALTGLGSTAAHADGDAVLPVASVADVVVDSVHERVFVSDRTGGKVVATDYSGNVVGTLGSLPQAGGLELSADSQTLYVAVTGSDEIAAIDTAGLTESARYSTGTADAPATLARAGGKLWFGYGTAASGNIGSLDLSGPDAVLAVAQDSSTRWYYAPRLASNPATPGVLAAGVPGLSPSAVATYDVSGPDAPRLLAQGEAGSNLRDLAVTPDGDQVVTASGWPYKHQVLSTTDLKEVGSYPTDAYPNAVDIAADGTVAAGIDGMYEPDVYIFEPGTTEPVRKYEFTDTGSGTLVPDGLAWEPDGDHLFAVTENGSTYRLNTLNAPTRAVTTVTVSAPSSVVPGKSLTVTGKISGGDPLPAGTSLTVTRTDTQSPSGKALAPVTTAEDGTFTFTDTPATEGDAKYTVSYAGDTGHAPASTTRTVAVSRTATTVTVSAPSSVVPGKSLTVTGKVSGGDPLPAGTSLTVTRTDTQSPSGKALAPVTTAEDGTFTFTDTPAAEGDAKYTVSYAGDTGHAPASTTRTVAVSRTATTVTVSAPATATRAKSLTVTGKVANAEALPAGTVLTVKRTDLESPSGKTLASVKTKADGTFSFTDTPPAGGDVKYAVSYAGDATRAAASGSDTVAVSRTATTLSLNNNGTVYSYDKDVTFTAHLGTTYKSRTVEIWANPYGSDKPNVLVKKATVNSSGNVSAVVDMKRDTTISAVFAGDARTAPKSVKVTAYAKVNVSTSLAKYYKTAKVSANSSTYYWYHKNTAPLFTTAMSSYPGRHYRLDIDVYVEGQWIRGYEEYSELGADGKSVLDLGTFDKAGTRVRIRSAYINDSSGDDVNSTTYSSWKYMYFTN
ncbi:Ig-like domain repeat protein [Streptomyces sp. NBC_00328]|uniref:Ig-like domain repeat protein n=1 Tax=Streptomyces sp. NBC_00328 TaxID=2903646 RepID=UPI002E2955EE|nr:Ig-like domain repeat protein [Streptomyces sp. NBC_00328]